MMNKIYGLFRNAYNYDMQSDIVCASDSVESLVIAFKDKSNAIIFGTYDKENPLLFGEDACNANDDCLDYYSINEVAFVKGFCGGLKVKKGDDSE